MGKQCDLGPARRWGGTCSTRGSSVTQKEDSPEFWNLDSVKSILTEPTYLLSFLPFSFSISSILHSFPTHDDIILPIYPIHLILLPIYYDDACPNAVVIVTAPASSRMWCTTLASSRTWCTIPVSCRFMYSPSQQLVCVLSQPAAGRCVQPQQEAGRCVQP